MSGGVVQVERVVELAHAGESRLYRLNQEALSRVLQGAGNRPVAVISAAGISRGGKSFLLNYCLRYLLANDAARRQGTWLGGPQQSLAGFSWSAGQERDTTGIWLATPQEVTLSSGEKVAVVLMDTQGTFDCQSTLRDCSTIFALSTLLCSMQIYNLKENITSNDLQYLKYFANYGQFAMSADSSETPFQALRFLVRDCYQPPYGLEGGRRLLQLRTGEHSQLTPELRAISSDIHRCFESVDCYLMPHPGLRVPSQEFRGNVAGLEPAFQDALRDLIPSILGPNSLRVKKLNGLPMNGRQLFQYFYNLLEVFSSDNMPELRNLADVQEEVSLANAAWTAKERFRAEIERTCSERAPRCPESVLRARHARARDDALGVIPRTASAKRRQEWQHRLEQELNESLNHYLLLNQRKNETAVSTAKNFYERAVLGDISERDICKHPRDLTAAHERGQAAALAEFDRHRECPTGADEERNNFVAWISSRYDALKPKNESNNDAAVTSCHAYFLETMPPQTSTTNKVLNAANAVYKVFTQPVTVAYELAQDIRSSENVYQLYTDTKREAIERFERKRNPGGCSYDVDPYKERLVALIEEYELPPSRYEVFSGGGSAEYDDPYAFDPY